jgi:predicted Zn-dependent protease
MKRIVIFLIVALALPISCSKNPVTGKRELSIMSEQQEIALGTQNDPSIVAQFGLYQDEGLQDFIDEKGQEMAAISHRSHLKYNFKILDSHVVNAFAVPGGYVYFTRGIMAHFNNEAEFAGVLGHEIGHITAKHSVKQYQNSILAQIGLIAGIIIKPELAQYMDVASQGLQLLFLKFGRDDESQSDELGVEYSTKIGYEAHEMADFFQTLNRLSGGPEDRIPTFLSTHPDPIDRYNTVHRLADEAQAEMGTAKDDLKVNRDTYLRRIEGLIYGEDPRQGYVDGNYFYHPEMKFVYPIPDGWQTLNSPIQVQMAPKDGKALMVLKLSQEKELSKASLTASEQYQFDIVDSQAKTINGLQALVTTSNQKLDPNTPVEQQTQVSIRSGYIKYGDYIYEFHGLATQEDFLSYKGYFDATIFGFKRLTDKSKIEVYPDKITIKTIPKSMTLGAYLKTTGINSERHEELAILNGMNLTDEVAKGALVKSIMEGKK